MQANRLFVFGLSVCMRCYLGRRAPHTRAPSELATLVDLLEQHGNAISQLPPMLLMVGDHDPLVHSSVTAHK